jgi:HAE1 family hydrophobic/amphiphilic exporter-1
MWMLGFSLNQLTLLALTLVIGILVDDSIVVIENIERHLEMKKPPMQAARDGRREIGLAAITITLVDVVVYVPVAFTSGIIGQFFYSYGLTVAIAALFSLFIAFTLTPMLAGLWLKDHSKPEVPPRGLRKFFGILLAPIGWVWNGFTRLFEAGFNMLIAAYGVVLRFCLRNFLTQSLVVVIAIAALVGGIFLVTGGFVGTEFFPQQDDGQLRITVEMPPGTNLDATDKVTRQIEQLLLAELPNEMTSILTQVGTGGGDGGFGGGGGRASNQATINVVLVDKEERERSTTAVVDSLRPLLARVPEAITSVALASGPGGGAGSPIQVQISGPDPDQLIELANQAEAVMKTVPGTTDVKNTDAVRSPETQLVVDRTRALDLDLSPAQVGSALRTALSGSQVGSYDLTGGTDVDIILRSTEATREDLSRLLQTPLKYVDNQPVLLERVVNIESSQAPARITRAERQRVLTVGSGITGRAAGDVTNDIEAALRENVTFPAGYGFEFIGQSEQQRESFAQLGQAILLAIALIYILLVALYQSWLQPLAIMFSLPVTLVGAIGGLWLFDQTLNLISLLGIVLLTGVVTKNAILIVDFANQLRENQGYERKEALVNAGRLRLRAIIMTTLTIIFALTPLLIGAGAGSETRTPMAAVVIGGLVSSTLLTLILVPVVYNFFDWSSGLTSRIGGRILGTGEAPPAKSRKEEAAEEEEKKQPEGEKGKSSPPRPSPQPSSAMSSFNPTD